MNTIRIHCGNLKARAHMQWLWCVVQENRKTTALLWNMNYEYQHYFLLDWKPFQMATLKNKPDPLFLGFLKRLTKIVFFLLFSFLSS